MKSFIKRNLLSIILAGVIILMIPAVIIVPKKLNKENDLAGTYRRYGEVNESYIDYTAVVEKMSDGRHMVTYTEKKNNGILNWSCKFTIPKDYEYGTFIEANDTDSRIKSVKIDVHPGYLFIIGVTDYDMEELNEVLKDEDYEAYNPIVETILKALLIILCFAFVTSILKKFSVVVGLCVTVIGAFISIITGIRSDKDVDYEGSYTLDKVPTIISNGRYWAFSDIYLKKLGPDSYDMYTSVVGTPMNGSYSTFDTVLSNSDVEYKDGKIVIDGKYSEQLGLTQSTDAYIEKRGDRYVVYHNEDDIIFEYRRTTGNKDYKMVYDIVRGLGVLLLFAVTLKKYIEYLKREKPDVFEQFYGVYDVSELICAGEEYSDFAAYAAQGIVGSIIKVAKDTFSIKDSDYNEVRYEFQKNIELLKGMYPEFENAQTVSVDVEENRYYLVHGKQRNAIITTMGGRMFIACEIRKSAECQQEGLI